MLYHRTMVTLSAVAALIAAWGVHAQDDSIPREPGYVEMAAEAFCGQYDFDSGWKMTSNISLGDPPARQTLNNSIEGFIPTLNTWRYISDPAVPGGNLTFEYVGTVFRIIGSTQNVANGTFIGSVSAQGYWRNVYYVEERQHLIQDTLDLGYHMLSFQVARNLTGTVTVESVHFDMPVVTEIPLDEDRYFNDLFNFIVPNRRDIGFDLSSDPRVTFTGDWSPQLDAFSNWTDFGTSGFIYARGAPQAQVTFKAPVNTSWFVLHSVVHPDLAAPKMTLDPPSTLGWNGEPPLAMRANSGNREFEFFTALVALSLDPTVEYTLSFTCDSPKGCSVSQLGIQNYYNAPNSTNGTDSSNSTSSDGDTNSTISTDDAASSKSDHGTKAGPIAGGVVGGVIGAALILAIVYFACRKRKQRPQPVTQERGLTIEDPEYEGDVRFQTSHASPILAKEPLWQSTDVVETLSERSLHPSMTTTYATGSQSQSPVTSPVLDRSLLTALKPSAPGSGRPLPLTPVGQPSSSHSRSPISPLTPSTAPDPRHAMPREPIRPRVEFDEDAGHIRASVVEDPVELLPPNYNPQWAEENERRRGGRSSSGQHGGADGPTGATSGAEAMSRRGTMEAWPHISEALERQAAADEAAGHPSTARGA